VHRRSQLSGNCKKPAHSDFAMCRLLHLAEMIFLSKQGRSCLNFSRFDNWSRFARSTSQFSNLINSEEAGPAPATLQTEMAVLQSVLGPASDFSERVGFRTFPCRSPIWQRSLERIVHPRPVALKEARISGSIRSLGVPRRNPQSWVLRQDATDGSCRKERTSTTPILALPRCLRIC
jgi:hypothetical protein